MEIEILYFTLQEQRLNVYIVKQMAVATHKVAIIINTRYPFKWIEILLIVVDCVTYSSWYP